jgi:membrane-associated protein
VHGVSLIPDLLGHPPLLGLSWMDPQWLLRTFGQEMFWISVVIVFIECGLLFPVLPGDTLLFFIGIFIGSGDLGMNIVLSCVIMSAAAFLGNVVGYEIGARVGPPLFERNGRFLNEGNLARTHRFFERYGNRALVLGRFVPVVRTFITVVAGVGHMERKRFFTWSLVGAVGWATGVTLLGYFLGGISFLQQNLELTLLLIVALSLVPVLFEWWRQRRHADQTG